MSQLNYNENKMRNKDTKDYLNSNENKLNEFKTRLLLLADIDYPSAEDRLLVEEAIAYGGPQNWTNSPKNVYAWAKKKEFEIKCHFYFLRLRKHGNLAKQKEYIISERKHINDVQFVLNLSKASSSKNFTSSLEG